MKCSELMDPVPGTGYDGNFIPSSKGVYFHAPPFLDGMVSKPQLTQANADSTVS